MAKKEVVLQVTLACSDCSRRNYRTQRNRNTMRDKIALRKYCPWCRQHTSHKEDKEV